MLKRSATCASITTSRQAQPASTRRRATLWDWPGKSKTGHPGGGRIEHHHPGFQLLAAQQVRNTARVLDAHRNLIRRIVDHHATDPVALADPHLELPAGLLPRQKRSEEHT